MTIAAAIALTLGALLFTLFVRKQDLPEAIPVSPLQHLEERKSAIYDNLRDLQFEYRLGKLSDPDYQATKLSLQKELSAVLAEMESTAAKLGLSTKRVPAKRGAKTQAPPPVTAGTVCPSCNARFEKPLKFCGECGKAMA